uniref:WD_REPEATS_REGION domain-containing protein n=1 Tax=Panagrellus redivivus TaxID=6233 RepID=A0A7E4VGH9_PANRE
MHRGLTPHTSTSTASTSAANSIQAPTVIIPQNRLPYATAGGYTASNGGPASPLITPAPVNNIVPVVQNNAYLGNGAIANSQYVEPVVREEIKSHFATAEGIYKKMTYGTYSRPSKAPIVNVTPGVKACDCPVSVSFVSCRNEGDENEQYNFNPEKMCFNVGRELFVYDYVSVHGNPNLSQPIDKRMYKGTFPTAHDFNQETATNHSISLIIGFSAGQVQLIDPLRKDVVPSKLFNEELNIDISPVTCVKWVPGMPNCFMVGHESGNIYTYNENFASFNDPPAYQIFKQGDGFMIFSVKTKAQRNPISRWQVGSPTVTAVNQFEFFHRNSLNLAIASQDGYLRVFDYHAMELIGVMKSYFGGLSCLSWSADGRLIATGGEDDLITVYSVVEKRVVCRGQGHKGWVAKVAFDPYSTGLNTAISNSSLEDGLDAGSLEDFQEAYTSGVMQKFEGKQKNGHVTDEQIEGFVNHRNHVLPEEMNGSSASLASTGYRLGSVGHDTELLLWDISEDILARPSAFLMKNGTVGSGTTVIAINPEDGNGPMLASTSSEGASQSEHSQQPLVENSSMNTSIGSSTKSKLKKFHKRGLSLGNRLRDSISRAVGAATASTVNNANGPSSSTSNGYTNGKAKSPTSPTSSAGMVGSLICPKMNQIPLIEPLIAKKIAHERLTVLIFREECIVTGCQEGFICTWARPGRVRRASVGSGKTTTSALGAIEGIQQCATNV